MILTKEDLEALEPPPSRILRSSSLFLTERLAKQWYERPYYAGPDGDEKEYFALVEALKNKESEGIAHWVMRKKYYSAPCVQLVITCFSSRCVMRKK